MTVDPTQGDVPVVTACGGTIADPDGLVIHPSGTVAGEYGTFVLTQSTGEWKYTVDLNAIQSMPAGTKADDSLSVKAIYPGNPAEVVIDDGGRYYDENPSLAPYVADVTVKVNQLPPSNGTGAVITATVGSDTSKAEEFGKITKLTIEEGGSDYQILGGPTDCRYDGLCGMAVQFRGKGKPIEVTLDDAVFHTENFTDCTKIPTPASVYHSIGEGSVTLTAGGAWDGDVSPPCNCGCTPLDSTACETGEGIENVPCGSPVVPCPTCGGECDGCNKCVSGCGCRDGKCVPCCGPCDAENPCPDGCCCINGRCVFIGSACDPAGCLFTVVLTFGDTDIVYIDNEPLEWYFPANDGPWDGWDCWIEVNFGDIGSDNISAIFNFGPSGVGACEEGGGLTLNGTRISNCDDGDGGGCPTVTATVTCNPLP